MGNRRRQPPVRPQRDGVAAIDTGALPNLDDRRPQAFDEAAVVSAVLGGDRDAFRHLVERESTAVIRACHRILGDLHEAEDAAQEAFVIAYRSLPSWRADGPFGAWLSRIAVRVALRQVSRRRGITWLDPVAADGSSDSSDLERVMAARSAVAPDPAAQVLRRERDATIRAAVAALDEPYREVVALRFFADLPLAEIARQTDRPLGTVKTHLHRGLQRLRSSIDAEGHR